MATQIFVNLPVKNLDKSVAFFTALGYTFNPQFTDEKATCMIIGENIFVMLLVEQFFKSFIKKEIADTSKAVESIICLSAESKEKIDALVATAVAAGGKIYKDPVDYGFMYQHSFEDLDGHLWEYAYMNNEAVEKGEHKHIEMNA